MQLLAMLKSSNHISASTCTPAPANIPLPANGCARRPDEKVVGARVTWFRWPWKERRRATDREAMKRSLAAPAPDETGEQSHCAHWVRSVKGNSGRRHHHHHHHMLSVFDLLEPKSASSGNRRARRRAPLDSPRAGERIASSAQCQCRAAGLVLCVSLRLFINTLT